MDALNPSERSVFRSAKIQLLATMDLMLDANKANIEVVMVRTIPKDDDARLACARFALRLLREDTTRERRAAYLALVLGSSVFVPRSQPPAVPWSGSPINDVD